MSSAGAGTVDPAGPRAELLLSLRARPGSGHPGSAALAGDPGERAGGRGRRASAPGASLTLGEPLFDGSSATAVLVGEPGGLVRGPGAAGCGRSPCSSCRCCR